MTPPPPTQADLDAAHQRIAELTARNAELLAELVAMQLKCWRRRTHLTPCGTPFATPPNGLPMATCKGTPIASGTDD